MRLKELRQKNNLSQTEFAKLFNMTQRTYANYEKETTQPPYEILIKIADYFKISLDYLMNHNTNNIIDLSNISETKKNLVKQILDLSDYDCNTIEGIIIGYFNGYETKNNEINHNIFFRGNK